MTNAKHATTLILTAIYSQRTATRQHTAFTSGPFSTELFFEDYDLTQAALYVRKHSSSYLAGLSVSAVRSILRDFVTDNFGLIVEHCFGQEFDCSFAEWLPPIAVDRTAAAMAESRIFIEPRALYLFPLSVVQVEEGYRSDSFFLASPSDLASQLGELWDYSDALIGERFPPWADWKGITFATSCWLGVYAPTIEAAKQRRAAILGAVALLPHHLERYVFSGRKVAENFASFTEKQRTFHSSTAHTPPLSEDIRLTADDRSWLDILAGKLLSEVTAEKRSVRALEYFYRAWAPNPAGRFADIVGAIDAIFNDQNVATQSIIDAVGPLMGPSYDPKRVRLLLGIRGSVIHGGAPNVYESSKYQLYYEEYGEDAVRDLEMVVARSLQSHIFRGAMVERAHNYAELIRQHTGRVV